VLAIGGANFASIRSDSGTVFDGVRASAFAFTTSVGRFVGAVITFLVGAGVSYFGTIGIRRADIDRVRDRLGPVALRRRNRRKPLPA